MRKENAPFIFISYAREDIAFVTRLKTDLSARGISSWIDLESIRPGTDDWEEELRKAIRGSSAILFAASPNARRSRHVRDELKIAAMYQRSIYPVWIHGNNWMEATPIGHGSIQYVDARGDMYPQALSALVQELNTTRGTSSTEKFLLFPPRFSLPHQPRNPYKGLRAFQGKDFHDFFGRDHFIQQLIQSLHHLLEPEQQVKLLPRLVTVIGPSGSGKSSIIMAGLLPRLQQGALLESQNWIYLKTIVPGEHPLEALTLALSSQLPARSFSSIREDLKDIRGLHLLMTFLMKQKETKVVLFIDQFEELFTQTGSEAERKHFLDLLITAAAEPQGPAIILLTLRADFYDRPLQYLELGQLIEDHHKAVLPMTIKELREVIEKPTQLPDVQMKFEDNLVGDILFDVQGQVGALPLLQFTLEQLFQYRDGMCLTSKAYQEIGGVKGALAKHAETTYTSLPSEDHRRLARALFLRLVDSGTIDQDATKRRIALGELILSNPTETAMLETVWQTFTEKRLLTTNIIGGTSTIELSHEALMKAWVRFTNWLQDAHEDIYFQGILRKDVTEWIRHDRNVERLYKGTQLIEAQAWRARNIPSREEDEFLQASIEQQRRAKQRTTRRALLISIAGLGLSGSAFYIGRLLLPGKASLPGKTSLIQRLPYKYPGHTGRVNSVAWSPNGIYIASGSNDKTVQVWKADTADLFQTYTGHTDVVTGVAWSPDGTRLASSSNDGTVHVWEANSGNRLQTYTGHTNNGTYGVTSVGWSPDGTRIASGGSDSIQTGSSIFPGGTVHVWEASSGKLLRTYTSDADTVTSVAWSPDGTRIVSGSSDRLAQIWEVSSGKLLQTYTGHTAPVLSVTWSPDGTQIASGSYDKTVQAWEVSSGKHLRTYTGHTGTVNNVAWSSDGARIASGSDDETVRIWEASSGSRLQTYTGHTDIVTSVAWSPDGTRIASGSYDKTVQEWNFSFTIAFQTYTGHTDIVGSVAWSPDGTWIASGSADKTVQVWKASSGSRLQTYTGHTDIVTSVAWSPDGTRIASGSYDKTVQVWKASTGNRLQTYRDHIKTVSDVIGSPNNIHIASGINNLAQLWNVTSALFFPSSGGPTGTVTSVAWSPDDKRIASGSDYGMIQIWETSSGKLLRTYAGHTHYVTSVAWSPDGTRLAFGSYDKTVQVWEASSGKLLRTYTGHTAPVLSVAWSSDGTRIASGSDDETVRIWEASSGSRLQTYTGHTGTVTSVAWSPDGTRLASGSYDKTVQVREASSGKLLRTYAGHTDGVTSVAWSPDGTRLASGSADGTVQIWKAN